MLLAPMQLFRVPVRRARYVLTSCPLHPPILQVLFDPEAINEMLATDPAKVPREVAAVQRCTASYAKGSRAGVLTRCSC